MHWIIQENLWNENAFTELVSALHGYDITHTIVKVIPFSHDLTVVSGSPLPNADEAIVVVGSTTLCDIAAQRGWKPGAWQGRNFDVDVWSAKMPQNLLLNPTPSVSSLRTTFVTEEAVFIRPVGGDKSFSGQVMIHEEFYEWKEGIARLEIAGGYAQVSLNTLVAVSPVQPIDSELRLFIVDGDVVTGSWYKKGGRSFTEPLLSMNQTLSHFVYLATRNWMPARAFVLDVAFVQRNEDEAGPLSVPKIIEVNAINASGFYAAKVAAYVQRIDTLPFPKNPRLHIDGRFWLFGGDMDYASGGVADFLTSAGTVDALLQQLDLSPEDDRATFDGRELDWYHILDVYLGIIVHKRGYALGGHADLDAEETPKEKL